MPSGVNFIIKHKSATVDAMKLKNYRVHKNPMGVDGDVVEGRYIYDSFVLDSKCNGIYVSSTSTGRRRFPPASRLYRMASIRPAYGLSSG